MNANKLIAAAQKLSESVDKLVFAAPVTHTYNPLDYAWACHEQYLQRFGEGNKRIVFFGHEPRPGLA